VALIIDTTRARRSHRELTELAEAVHIAPVGEPETHALEWKSTLDLAGGAATPRFKLAKPIIAFANRSPDMALQEFEGCAYVLVGVEPQNVPGIAKHDPADVDTWLVPYTGAQGPRWSIDYVQVAGRDVLVVTVEPSRWGDRIFVLEKPFENFAAGRPFVRRQGKSAEPDPSEIRMLEGRLKRTGAQMRLAVDLAPDQPMLMAYSVGTRDWPDWMNEERHRLYAPLAPTPKPAGVYTPAFNVEGRTREEYQREVEEYTDRTTWQALIWEEAVSSQLAPVKLRIVNPTDLNYAEVEVEVDLPDAVYAFFSADDPGGILETPEPPELWNTSLIALTVNLEAERNLRELARARGLGPGKLSAGPGPWKVQFTPIDLRPQKTVALPVLFLAVPDGLQEGVDRTLDLRWTATSKSANGSATGTLTVSIAPGSTPLTAPLA
jgi:hypothetical protein